MSRKRISIKAKKSAKSVKSSEISAKDGNHSRKRKLTSSKLITVILIAVVVIAIIACAIGYFVNANHMDEVPMEDAEIVALAKKYFRGEDACTDYSIKLFTDEIVSMKTLDYNTKEELAIEYAITKRFDQIGYYELNEVYHLLFNDGTDLQKKAYYESTSGYYEQNGETYDLYADSSCASANPYEMTCHVFYNAYKSDRGAKIIFGIFSGTAEDGYIYSGLNWDAEPLGLYGDVDIMAQNLERWEAVFKYDNKLNRYYLDYTKKL